MNDENPTTPGPTGPSVPPVPLVDSPRARADSRALVALTGTCSAAVSVSVLASGSVLLACLAVPSQVLVAVLLWTSGRADQRTANPLRGVFAQVTASRPPVVPQPSRESRR